MSRVSAASIWGNQQFTADGSENPVVFTDFSDSDGWINVQAFSRLTIQVETGSTNTNTFQVEARVHPSATAFDLIASPSATGTDTVERILEARDVMPVHSIRLLENGTADTHNAYFILK